MKFELLSIGKNWREAGRRDRNRACPGFLIFLKKAATALQGKVEKDRVDTV
jgi:hypothetical protein